MASSNFILQVKSLYNSFSKTEKKIADYLFENSGKVIYLSVTEFAEKCEVGETSIIRFCRRIGLKGYQEFKLILARESVSPKENFHARINDSNDIEGIINSITAVNIEAIENTSKILSRTRLQKSVDAILSADKVDIYGVGASAFTAGDAKYKFMRIGINCECVSDPHFQCMSAVNLTSKSVAIGISFSGSTKDTIDSLSIAKKTGAFTIAITNYEKSPITKYADAVLLSSAEETPLRSGALTSKIAQLQILDILYTAVAIRMEETAYKNLNKTGEAVLSKMY
jgi:RpiR family transcriptional regulator, carbohydrate utilization regulator